MKKMIVVLFQILLFSSCNSQESVKGTRTPTDGLLKKLAIALEKEDVDKIKRIISDDSTLLNLSNSNSNDTDYEIEPILFWTIKNDKYVSFKTLLELGANVNIQSATGFTPLILACQSDYTFDDLNTSLSYVKDLVEKGADINYIRHGYYKEIDNEKKFYRATSPLNAAIQRRNIDLVKYLFSEGVDLNATLTEPRMGSESIWKFNALMSAISRKDMKMAKFLLIDGKADYSWVLGLDYSNRPLDISYFLRRCYFLKDSEKFNDKKQILEYLIGRGVNYRGTEIPDKAIKFAKRNYPNSWEKYLESY